MLKQETAFTLALIENMKRASELTGVEDSRLLSHAEKDGGVKAVKNMLARGQVHRQFDPLKKIGRLDLSPEALVIQGKYSPLFTDEEANICLSALLEAGMF